MIVNRLAFAAVAAVMTAGAAAAQAPVAKPAAAAAAPGAAPKAPAPPPGTPAQQRPGLFFKEEWQNVKGGETAVDLATAVKNPDLEMKIYGQGINMVGKAGDENNPPHLFSGEAKGPVAFTLRNKKAFADLSVLGRIRVDTKMSGLHKVYPIVKLASGDWYLADKPAGNTIRDWVVEELSLADAHWFKLDIANVVTKGNPVDKIDLTKVDEIGFADLMPGSGHGPGGWYDVGEISVFGKTVTR